MKASILRSSVENSPKRLRNYAIPYQARPIWIKPDVVASMLENAAILAHGSRDDFRRKQRAYLSSLIKPSHMGFCTSTTHGDDTHYQA